MKDVLILDGAMGTELERRGFPLPAPLWSAQALLDAPNLVRQIHADYLLAGAQVITTNSFRTQKRTLEKAGIGNQARHLTMLSVQLAREAARDTSERALIAGSLAPLEDCLRPDLSPGKGDQEFIEIGWDLMDAGADFLLIETMNNLTELRSAIRAAQTLAAPFWVSVTPFLQPQDSGFPSLVRGTRTWEGARGWGTESPQRPADSPGPTPNPAQNAKRQTANETPTTENAAALLSDEPLTDALRVAEEEGAARFLVNCAIPSVIEQAMAEIAAARIPFGAYANNGGFESASGVIGIQTDPEGFADHAARLVEMGATAVGGCCGTTPDFIRAVRERLESSV